MKSCIHADTNSYKDVDSPGKRDLSKKLGSEMALSKSRPYRCERWIDRRE